MQAARALAPLPVQSLATASPSSASDATAPVRRAPERVPLAATFAAARDAAHATAQGALAVGAIGRRAEQLGGVVGVRAASLSIDFVDPARLSLLTAPAMPTVGPPEAAPRARDATDAARASDSIMPAARPLFATAASASGPAALTAEEWSLVAAFPSAATAMQLATARQVAQWSDGSSVAQAASRAQARTAAPTIAGRSLATPARTLLTAISPAPATASRVDSPASSVERAGATAEYVATPATASSPVRLPGGRTPRGSFTWSRLAEFTPAAAEWTAPATVTAVEQAARATPGTPLWGVLAPLVSVAPSLAARAGGDSAGATTSYAPVAAAGHVRPANHADASVDDAAASGRPALDPMTLLAGAADAGGRREAGAGDAGAGAATRPSSESHPPTRTPADARGATRAGASNSSTTTRGDAPAMTLMTAAATRESRAAARLGTTSDAVGDGSDAPATQPLVTGGAGGGVSNVRPRQTMPLMTSGPAPRDGSATGASTGLAARAVELARPFLRLVEGGIAGGETSRSSAPRFFEQPQPVVAGAPSSDSASKIVEALRHQPASSASDDRVSLADLTLIAIASATQQVAASPAGGSPGGGGGSSPAAPSGAAAPASGQSGGTGNPAQEIEELARAAFDELQRLIEIARERSGDHG